MAQAKKPHIGIKDLQQLIKNRCHAFQPLQPFNYTWTIKDGSMELDTLFDSQLTQFLGTITKPTNASRETPSALL